jgi:dCMP deaminase
MINIDNIEIVTDEMYKYFLQQAYFAATELSDDPVTKVGAVLVKKEGEIYRMIARGANVLPRSILGTREELTEMLINSDWKRASMNHAEPTTIKMAQSLGYDTTGTIMFMPWVPCLNCGEYIFDAGITQIVGHKAMIIKTPERWHESTNKAIEYLLSKNVKCLMYDGSIGGVTSTFNSEIWFP